jgi:hypothetical protein
LLLRLHPEAKLIAVQIINVEIAHPVWIILGLTEDYRAPRFELLIQGIHVSDEDIDCAMSGQPLGAIGGLEMNDHSIPFNSRIERRRAIRELGTKTQRVTVMLDATKHVLYDK